MMITLLDGTTVDTDFLRFDREHYHFYLGTGALAQDLTNLITRADKRAIVSELGYEFNDEFENERIYVAKYFREHGKLPPEVGSDSVWWNWTVNMVTDPLDAPIKAGADWLASTTTGNVIVLAAVAWAVMTFWPRNR